MLRKTVPVFVATLVNVCTPFETSMLPLPAPSVVTCDVPPERWIDLVPVPVALRRIGVFRSPLTPPALPEQRVPGGQHREADDEEPMGHDDGRPPRSCS